MDEATRERMHGRGILSSLSGLDALYHRKPSVETLGYGQACPRHQPISRWRFDGLPRFFFTALGSPPRLFIYGVRRLLNVQTKAPCRILPAGRFELN
jgi:hypothetical protein